MTHLEKRIFKPISRLQEGVIEIARGNYQVKIEHNVCNEIGFLMDSFNHMAAKLRENEIREQEYEENRKALIANISHDLKTPITAIQGYMEAIEDGVAMSPEKTAQYLQVIRKNTEYLNRLIDDLFLFAKLDMQQVEFRMETLPVGAYMADLMAEFSFEFQEKGFGFHYTNQMTEDDYLDFDRKRVYQAIRNIIGNAIKYGPQAGLKLDTRLYKQNGYVCLEITDNVPGIPADQLPRIFERFYRIDAERTKDLMSTGLGLSIAKELIEAHGGRITATSAIGEGSCFTLMLPLSDKKEPEDEAYSNY
ncbi:HAMP domain-containing histidine kinase [Dehalobacter sp. DCM]|uniref:HAMP domain-containing sensor histidine kinase n=1 Tax=Dehalobacter sp. DCM TaxID=2907827 RepID=UPI0030820552|nr:HAMP domain-containing histidine kinase [Dehalobacter sp. DCM]